MLSLQVERLRSEAELVATRVSQTHAGREPVAISVLNAACCCRCGCRCRHHCCCCCCCWCCCCWQPLRLTPRGVVRFLCWHVLKLELWHFVRPQLNFALLSHRFLRCFIAKKCAARRAALIKNMLSSAFRIVFSVFSCVCVCVLHFASVFTVFFCRLSTFCTCRRGLAFVFQLCAGVGPGGGLGVGGGDDVHANATFVCCFLCSPCSGLFWCGTLVGRGGG